MTIVFDAFVSGGDVSRPIWERTPLALLVWWPVPHFERLFNVAVGPVEVLLPNLVIHTLLIYSFFWWRAKRVRLP